MNNTITIPINENLADLKDQLEAIMIELAKPEWAMLLKFYRATEYVVSCKGDSVEVVAKVWGKNRDSDSIDNAQ